MKRKTFLLVVVTSILLSSVTAFARLGETPDQCQLRYGTAKSSNGAYSLFYKDHFDIAVLFRDGKSFQETFSPNGGGGFTETLITELLTANAEGSTWLTSFSGPAYKSYRRQDGNAEATFDRGSLHIRAVTAPTRATKLAPPSKEPTTGL